MLWFCSLGGSKQKKRADSVLCAEGWEEDFAQAEEAGSHAFGHVLHSDGEATWRRYRAVHRGSGTPPTVDEILHNFTIVGWCFQ